MAYPDRDYDMAIKFGIDEDGEFLALVDTELDFEAALEFDCPILAAPEIVEAWGILEIPSRHSLRRRSPGKAGHQAPQDSGADSLG